MARSNNLQVRITSDTSQFDAGIRRAQQELRTFGNIAKTAFSLVGVTSFAAAIRSAVGNIASFEKANSELAAVLGTTKDGVKGLSEAAKNLAIQSKYTASEVTSLQVALSRLGFNAGQIEAMEGSVLKFATAMDTDLASAADFTGAALRAFGLQAEDTGKMLDVLAASTTNSALDFGKLQSSISTVAPIANAFGLDVKETASLLGVLANNGFDASSAATALRNILLNLSDSNGKLSQGIGHSVKNFDELIAAFKELDRKGVDVNSVLQMTDKRSAAAAMTIIKQADAVSDLKVQLDEAEGSLDTMASTMEDNLIGAVNNLKSAWEGFTLKLSESAGPLATVTNGLAEFFRALAGKDSTALQQQELEEFRKGMNAQNLAATLRNGGQLNKKEQKQYNQLKDEGYITPNSYQITSRGKDQQGYYNMVRRSDEFGYWGNEQREAMSESQIEAYEASLKAAADATTTLTTNTANSTKTIKGLTQAQKDALATTQSWAKSLVADVSAGAPSALTGTMDAFRDSVGYAVTEVFKDIPEGGEAAMDELGKRIGAVASKVFSGLPGASDAVLTEIRDKFLNATPGIFSGLPAAAEDALVELERRAGDAADTVLASLRSGAGEAASMFESLVRISETGSTELQNRVAKAASDAFNAAAKAGKTSIAEMQADAQNAVYDSIRDYAKEMSSEAAEIAAADAEMEQAAADAYAAWRDINGMTTQVFNPDEQRMYNEQLQLTVQYWEQLGKAKPEEGSYAWVQNYTLELEKLNQSLTDAATTMSVTMVGALGSLVGDLATGGDAVGNFANTALSTFGDMAVQVGKMMIEFGLGAEGIQLALTSLNPYVAIAAGAALVALGSAVKSGLANIATGSYSAGANVASSSYNTAGSDFETRDLNIHVTGKLTADGDQLNAIIDSTNNRNGYTT